MEEVIGAGIRVSFNDVIKLTDEFSDENLVVKTEHFNLFRGKFGDQLEHVTIKIWHCDDKFARIREEITILSQPWVLDCPNIVKLMGYCCEGDHVGTIYKLHSVDTLENLFDKDEFQWRDRMIAALGIARLFHCLATHETSHLINTALPFYIILDQESNPVLFDVQILTGGDMLLHQGAEASSVGNDKCISSEDVLAGKMKPTGVFELGVLLLRLAHVTRNIVEDDLTKLSFVGYPNFPLWPWRWPGNCKLKLTDIFFYECDYYSVIDLGRHCVESDECPTIGEVIRKLEKLLLFSLPVRTASGMVAVGGRTLVYFTYGDLCRFTDNFSVENLFSITQFGEAYRGRIQQGLKQVEAQDIVVKMWGVVNVSRSVQECLRHNLLDDVCRLRDEVVLLTQRWMIDNPNVAELLGYCFEGTKLGAVYRVQPLYTLQSVLDDEWFEWKDRIMAALELARTLALLHGKEQQYLICNISADHIMIDKAKKPILYDFSMLHGQVLSGQRVANRAKLCPSIDYCDPYFLQTGLVVPESDIFAFGAVLLSLICKRDMWGVISNFIYPPMEDEYKSKSSLAHESFTSHPSFDYKDACKLTKLAMDCLGLKHLLARPTASDVVEELLSLSLFSDALPSMDVKVKVIDSYANIGRKPSCWKHLRDFRKLSIAHNKLNLGKSQQSKQISADARQKLKEIVKGPTIFRPAVFEETPEEIRSRIQEIEAEIEEEESRRELRKTRVNFMKSAHVRKLAA